MPAVGFGMGIERLIMTLEKEQIEIPKENLFDLYIGTIGEEENMHLKLAHDLRHLE